MGTITVIDQVKGRKANLIITWKPMPGDKTCTEVHRNIKTLAAARKIVGKRNTENMKAVRWNGIDLLKKSA